MIQSETVIGVALAVDTLWSVCGFIRKQRKLASIKKNPLKNRRVMGRLNPYALVQKKAAKEVEAQHKRARQAKIDAARGVRLAQCDPPIYFRAGKL